MFLARRLNIIRTFRSAHNATTSRPKHFAFRIARNTAISEIDDSISIERSSAESIRSMSGRIVARDRWGVGADLSGHVDFRDPIDVGAGYDCPFRDYGPLTAYEHPRSFFAPR